jgi:hypothetical protein
MPWADASKEAAVLLYAPGLDPFLEELPRIPIECGTSTRAEGIAMLVTKEYPKTGRCQTTPEGVFVKWHALAGISSLRERSA